jgi:anti-sigma factor ChrR (cupin superfamily)
MKHNYTGTFCLVNHTSDGVRVPACKRCRSCGHFIPHDEQAGDCTNIIPEDEWEPTLEEMEVLIDSGELNARYKAIKIARWKRESAK